MTHLGPRPWYRAPWAAYVLPFAVYMAVGSLEPVPSAEGAAGSTFLIPYRAYPIVYTLKIVLSVITWLVVSRPRGIFRPRFAPAAIIIGVVGAASWIGICHLRLEEQLGLSAVIKLGERPAYNPFREISPPPAAWAFLSLRWLGLIVVVPVIEECFLRGFVMRFLAAARWWDLPLDRVTRQAVLFTTLLAVAAHPAELIAEVVWFTLVTWLMFKSKDLADCITAHGVTNFLLGVYVLLTGNWHLM